MSATVVEMKTTYGAIKIELDNEKAPKTVENFLSYANAGFYDGTIFHRVIDNFMIQGGGFDGDMQQKETAAAIENEADNGLKNDRGTIAMARTMDPHSATSQFFINHKDNTFLNFAAENTQGWGYAVFGQVISGMDIVDQIAISETTTVNGYQDAPVEPVTILYVTIDE